MEIIIKFNNIDQISDFVQKISKYDCNFDAYVTHQRNTVDAKSVMGLMALGCGNNIVLCIHKTNKTPVDEILNAINEYRT